MRWKMNFGPEVKSRNCFKESKMRGRGDGNKMLHGNEIILGRTCSMIRRTKLLTSQYLLPLKTDHLELSLLLIIWIAYRTIMIHSVNDIILVSMVMGTGGPTVWFDRQRNKYNPGIQFVTILLMFGHSKSLAPKLCDWKPNFRKWSQKKHIRF